MSFFLSVFQLGLIYLLFALASGWLYERLNIVSLSHALVLGASSYSFALSNALGNPLPISIISGIFVSLLLGAVITLSSQWLNTRNFALFTFALQTIWLGIISTSTAITGGALGMSGIPLMPQLLVTMEYSQLLWSLGVVLLMGLLIKQLDNKQFAMESKILSSNKELALTLGIATLKIRAKIGLVYGAIMGCGGVLLASYLSYINDQQFSVELSISILVLGLFSRLGIFKGPLIGVALLIITPELLRLLDLQSSNIGFIRNMVSGLVLLLFIFAELESKILGKKSHVSIK